MTNDLTRWKYHLFQRLATVFRARWDPYRILLWIKNSAIICVRRNAMAGLQQVLARLTHYSRDIFPTVKLKPTNKVTMTPLVMMLTTVLTYFLIWIVMEQMKGWMSSFLTQQMPHDHEVSLLNTYPRYGTYLTKMPNGLLIRQLKHLYEHKTLRCRKIMVLMTACFIISAFRITSSWIPSLLLRKVVIPLVVIHVANSLSLTKDSYKWYQCTGNLKFSRL